MKKTTPDLFFIRIYPYYVQLQTGHEVHPFSFQVQIMTMAPLNKKTGMTVNLVKLDACIQTVLKPEILALSSINELFKIKIKILQKKLLKNKIKLESVQFDECRGFSALFENKKVTLIRRDFALDQYQDLFEVHSYFDEVNKLQKIKMKNIKLEITEEITF